MTLPVIRDPAFPGLEAAMRGEVEQCLSTALRGASGGAWSIGAATPIRFRYRPRQRAIVQYSLLLFGPHGDARVPAALWFFSGGKAAKLARKMNVEGLNGAAPPPVALDPATGGLLQIFPHDHRVPQLAAFLDKPGTYAGALAEGSVGTPELVRFRPGIGATFRWRRASGTGVYVKIYPGTDSASLFTQREGLRRAAAQAGFATPRIVGSADEISAVSIEAIVGPDLGDIISTGRLPEIRAATRRVGRALVALHRCAADMPCKMDHDAMARRSASTAATIGNLCSRTGQTAQRLANWINESSAPLRPGPAHMDVKPEHLIVTEGAVTFLDLDSMARSDGLYDIAMLEMRIRSAWASGRFDADQTNAAISELYDAYPGDGETGWRRRLAWLRACAALQVARHHAQNPSDGWRECAIRLLDAGRPQSAPYQESPVAATTGDLA
jgi:hypothetical protein